MFLPIGTDRPRKRPTVVTYWLFGLCVGIHAILWGVQGWSPEGFERVRDVLTFFPGEPGPVGLLGYQFVHADLMHLLGNMLFLWVFGPPVEDRFGRIGFLSFYLVGGMAAAGVHAIVSPAPVIGASGAISGVTGAFLVLFPLTHVRILLFFILIGVFMIPAWWFIAFAIAKDLFFQAAGGGRIAYAAHLGGYAYGAAISGLLLWRKIIPREPFDLFSIGRQAHRRRRFREMARKGQGVWSGQADAPPKRVARRTRPSPEQEERAEMRTEIERAAARGDMDAAARTYLDMLSRHTDAGLGRDALIRVANHLFSSGDHTNAATAYETFLRRYRSDREANDVRLMLALVCARYLNDPIRASQLLGETRMEALDAEHRSLAEAIRDELGEPGSHDAGGAR